MKKKILSVILTLGIVQSLLSGCGADTDVVQNDSETIETETTVEQETSSEDSNEDDDSEQVTVRIGYFNVNNATAELYVASELGYIDEELGENVTVELVPFANGPAANEAFTAGEIDFQNGIGDLPLLNGWRNGIDTVVLAQTGGSGEHIGLVVSNNSGVSSVEELKGKNVGVYIGTTFHKSVLGILSDHGLSSGDVNLVNIDSTTDGIAALESGELDAYYVASAFYVDYAEENDIGYLLEDSTAYPSYGYFVGTSDFVNSHPEETKALLRALKRGADYINDDKEQGAKVVADFLGTEEDTAFVVLNYLDVTIELDDKSVSNLYNAENFLNDIGVAEVRVTDEEIESHIDYSFLEEVLNN